MSDRLTHRHLAWLPSMTLGEPATAAFLIAAASGVAVAIAYDPVDALTSVAMMQMANPAAAFFRNIHYWSTQAFLILTVLHAWDHMRRREPRPVGFGVWTRICLSVPAIVLLAWSGFVLKGDAESWQALRVVRATIADVPGVGPLVATALFGRSGDSVTLVYLHHAATFTLVVWFSAVEHGRLLWPRPVAVLSVLVPTTMVSLWLSPALHDGLSATIKGPWYFAGLQELLHWSPWPRVVVAAAVLPLLALFAMRWMHAGRRRIVAYVLLAATIAYGGLTVVGWAFRGPNWAWTGTWSNPPASLVFGSVFAIPDPVTGPLGARPVPVVMARPEGCLVCHQGVTGLSRSHDPATIGCASCHLGNVFSLDAATAHAGMLVVPGNLADAAQTCGGACHPSIVPRVERSLMTSNAGIVAVDRRSWNDERAGAGPAHIATLGFSTADTHLRQLCASCHLGAAKTEPWPIGEESRGGGCTACHVAYSAAAREALDVYRAGRSRGTTVAPPAVHPNIALPTDNTPCFGCHSRSGRISLSYDGWHEVDPMAPADGGRSRRRLDDGRDVVQVSPDAHATKGLLCIDCHTARDVMGDGVRHRRQLDQAHVACTDCHAVGTLRTIQPSRADEEARRIATLRRLPTGDGPLLLATPGDAFVNAFLQQDGTPRLVRKKDAQPLELRPPAAACRDGVHGRVSCIGCHTAWAPRCPTCHTAFDPGRDGYDELAERATAGEWIESGGNYTAVPPTLGLRWVGSGPARNETYEPFVPGMIATLDPRKAPRASGSAIVRRWYSRTFSHTVTRAGRTCQSCHNDPVALGYGEGRLEFVPAGPQTGRWRFVPAHAPAEDGLPADAWVGFLQTRGGSVSTRDDVRPLSVEEQRRVLSVGACLTCHAAESPVMRESLRSFERVSARRQALCRTAVW